MRQQKHQKQQDAHKITLQGVIINLLLGASKVIIGVVFNSKALLADGMHSLLDLISDAAVIIALYWSSRPEDDNHHYGHHKFTSFAQLFIGILIFIFAAGLIWSVFSENSTQEHNQQLSGITVVIAVVSVIIKEILFWRTRAVAIKIKSELIMANAWHHRSDSISSLAVSITLLAIWLGGPNWRFLDDIISVILGSYLAIEAGKIIWKSSADLLDTAPRQEIIDDLREHIFQIPDVIAYHDFRVRKTGDYYEVDFHLQLPPDISLKKGHDIAKLVKLELCNAHPEIFKVLIHIEPATKDHLIPKGISETHQMRPPSH